MDESILNPIVVVYCEHCKREFPMSRPYAEKRLDNGLPLLCVSCEQIVQNGGREPSSKGE